MLGRTREQRKASAFLRAQLSLKQAVERIDYDFDVIRPKLAEIAEIEKTAQPGIGPSPEDAVGGQRGQDESGLEF